MTVDLNESATILVSMPTVDSQLLQSPRNLLLFIEALISKSRFGAAEHYLDCFGHNCDLAPQVQILRARILLSRGDIEKGTQLLVAIAQSPAAAAIPPDLAAQAAARLERQYGWSAALAFLNKINTVADPETAVLHAKLLALARKIPAAVALVERCAMRTPFPVRARLLYLHGRLKVLQKDYVKATFSMGRGLTQLPPDWRLYCRAAMVAEKASNLRAAERWLGMAVSFGAPPMTIIRPMTRLRLASGNIQGAVQSLRAVLSKLHDPNVQLLLAKCLLDSERRPQALAEVEDVLRQFPDHLDAKRMQVEILLSAGRVSDATFVIEEFAERVSYPPGKGRFLSELQDLVAKCEEETNRNPAQFHMSPLPPAFRLSVSERDLEFQGSLFAPLKAQVNIVGAIIIRETVGRFGETRLGYLWAILEPCVQIIVLAVIYWIAMKKIPYNMSLGQFLITGILSFFFFMNTYNRAAIAVRSGGNLLAHPAIKQIDLIWSATILELATQFGIFTCFMVGTALSGDPVRIGNPLVVGLCLILMWCGGVGLGLFVDAMAQYVGWARLIGWAVVRKLFFASGLFFAPEQLPSWLEKISMYNPLLNIITEIRANFSPFVHTPGLSLSYGAAWCLGTLMLGFTAHLAVRRR